jgi:2-amino-4-hydroxy-6-hydroxymethyldihydropteridine diphosphokinase
MNTVIIGVGSNIDPEANIARARDLLDRDAFAAYLRLMEDRLGRVRTANKFGPRTIDLDIVVWNGEIVNADYSERDFVRDAVRELLG